MATDARHVLDLAMSEDTFLAMVKKYAELRGWLFYHPWKSSHSVKGFPDCTMVRGGSLIFAELKSEKGKISEAQARWLRELSVFGGRELSVFGIRDLTFPRFGVYVWRPSDWAKIGKTLK